MSIVTEAGNRINDNMASFALGVMVGALVLFCGYQLGKQEASPRICVIAPPPARPGPPPPPRPAGPAPRISRSQQPTPAVATELPAETAVLAEPIPPRPSLRRPVVVIQPQLQDSEGYPKAQRRLPRPQPLGPPPLATECQECDAGQLPPPGIPPHPPSWEDWGLRPGPWGPGPMAQGNSAGWPPPPRAGGRPDFGPPAPFQGGPPPGY